MNDRELRAMKKALAGLPTPAIPPELKAQLLKEARQAARRASPVMPILRWGAVAFAAAAVAIVIEIARPPAEVVSVDELLSAHRRYERTMPFAGLEAEDQ